VTADELPGVHSRVVRALAGGGPAAPPALHARIDALVRRSTRPARRYRRAAPIAVAASLALVAVLALAGSGESTHNELARLATRPAAQPSPAADPRQPTQLARRFENVAYPNWSDEFDWDPAGARTDRVAGRRTDTVFYVHTHHRIAYTIVAGPPLGVPAGADSVRVGGVEIHRFRDGPLDVVTFVRNGRTCVLSGDVHDPDTLLKLAAWRAT
jgi:hypothetical protein